MILHKVVVDGSIFIIIVFDCRILNEIVPDGRIVVKKISEIVPGGKIFNTH